MRLDYVLSFFPGVRCAIDSDLAPYKKAERTQKHTHIIRVLEIELLLSSIFKLRKKAKSHRIRK